MQKKISILLLVMLTVSTALLFSGVGFKIAPVTPLFREYLADPYAPSSKFNRLTALTEESIPKNIYYVDEGQYAEIPFTHEGQKNYFNLKVGANVGLLRFETGFFQMEAFLYGGLNTLFEFEGATDNLGFDGFYAVGGSLRLWDVVAIQGGIHHFSGHWGDEILKSTAEENSAVNFKDMTLLEYTRDNSWIIAISIEPTKTFRFYSTVEMPQKTAWVRPAAHVPVTGTHPNKPMQEHIAGQEGVEFEVEYPSSYRALRVQVGSEVRFPLYSLGDFFIAGDFQFHQDGKTLHLMNSYSETNPWEFTMCLGLGFEFNRGYRERKVRLESFYHYGRLPLLNFFFQRGHYVSVGVSISG